MNLEYSKGPSLLPSEYDVGALRRYQDEFYRAAEELDEVRPKTWTGGSTKNEVGSQEA